MTTTPAEAFRQDLQRRLFGAMPEHVARLGWSTERIALHQRDALRRLLADARERSPFHARRLAHVEPERFELADLASLPTMTKADLMDAFDEVVTDRRLTRAVVEEALERTGAEPQPLFGEYLCQVSGGSSGRRGVFVVDREGMTSFGCSLLRPTIARRARAGAPAGLTIAFVAAASAVHATGLAPWLMEGTPIRFVPLPATLPIASIVERLNALRPPALYGYASMIVRLAAERAAGRLRIGPEVVTCTSETLLPEQRTAIAEAFGVSPVDVFGSSEGLAGVSDPGEAAITFASDGSIVELVDEHDRPVAPGTPSARILLTNLANRAQPLVRYVIEDCFVREPDAAEHGHLRARVHGRTDDVLRFGDVEIHPLAVRTVLVKTPAVIDYQVRQTHRGLDVALLVESTVETSEVAARLRRALEQAGLREPSVRVAIVPALERQAASGKLRRFLPLRPGGDAVPVPPPPAPASGVSSCAPR